VEAHSLELVTGMRLYIDVETYRKESEDVFLKEKVIAVGVIEDWTEYRPESSKIWNGKDVTFHYFTEWSLDGEPEVILAFYDYLYDIVERWRSGEIRFLTVVGFNILRFDIPLLIQKGVEYSVGDLAELNKLWHNTYTIDYLQTTLPFHDMRFKDLKLEYLANKAKKAGIEIPEPYGSGENVKIWYENGEYGKILEHLETDLRIIRIIDLKHKLVYGTTDPANYTHTRSFYDMVV